VTDRTGPPFQLAAHLERVLWPGRDDRPHWQRVLVEPLRLIWAVGRDIAAGQITLRAMSLVYTTLLALVPLLAISFSILKGFGVHNQIEPFLQNALEPLGERRDEVVSRIVTFVDNVQVGVLGSVGFLLLFYTAVSLMQKIEHAFNEVWQVSGARSFSERFKDYLTVIIIGPVLVFSSIGLTATVMADPVVERITSIQPVGWLVELATRLVPIAMVVLAFTFIYVFVPHTRVRLVPALTGGLVAGVLWHGVGWLFAGFVAQANRYEAIYSGFATPILFMIWLYVGWLILLVGASIAFYRQHPEYLIGRRLASDLSPADTLRLALDAVCLVGQRFYAGEPAPDTPWMAHRLRVPERAVREVLEPLEWEGILAASNTNPPAFLPGRPWETTSVHHVLRTLQQASRRAPSPHAPQAASVSTHPAVDAVLRRQVQVSEEAFGALSLKTLVGGEEPTSPSAAAETTRLRTL
jgi:membrane protein